MVLVAANFVAVAASVAVSAFPPIFKFATGVVDVTTNGAVPVVIVDTILFAVISPPIFTFPVTPNPPDVVIDPVVVFDDCVVLVTFTVPVDVVFPVTSNVPFVWVLPETNKLLLKETSPCISVKSPEISKLCKYLRPVLVS